jgi:signal transduction histidine kinase
MEMKSILFSKRAWSEFLFLLSGGPLGVIWFSVLVTAWSLFVGLAITPFIIPIALAMPYLIRGMSSVESTLARELLHVNVYPPRTAIVRQSFWRRMFGWLGDVAMWKAQVYLVYRAVVGFAIAVGLVTLLGLAIGGIAAPFYYWALNGGIDFSFWHVDTLPKALVLVPAGAAGFVITMLLSRLLSNLHRDVAQGLLEHSPDPLEPRPAPNLDERHRMFALRATSFGVAFVVLVIVWAISSTGYFWPVWPLLAFLLLLGIEGTNLFVIEHPEYWKRPGMSQSLAAQIGSSTMVVLFLTGVWAAAGGGTYWPVWPLLGLGIACAARSIALYFSPPGQQELTERIETLTSTRAGAVDQQEAELRRIERDLHDGAQARLVALGMSIGMAEQKLAEDPEGARQLLEEARTGAGQALKELRDLARGIHPPVLADRGLEAAVTALADNSPLRVTVHADITSRPAAPVESAAYFVVAEALANAGKYSQAKRVDIRMTRDGDVLTVEVVDDGVGGANADGGGLSGLRRRIEALDGTLRIASPAGGPTLIRAEMPCGS